MQFAQNLIASMQSVTPGSVMNFVLWWTLPALAIWVLSFVYREAKKVSTKAAIPFAIIILSISWYAQSKIGWQVYGITGVFYLVYCWFQFARNEHDKATGWRKVFWGVLVYAALIIGGPLDVIYQHTIAIWPIFWDHAEEMLLTQRLARYKYDGRYYHTWRYWIAIGLCAILDPWQAGGH